MKKNVIAIVAAVALVLLAVPTIAFANGMQQTWCPSGGAGSLAHHAMRAAGDSDAGATVGAAIAAVRGEYVDRNNDGVCDNYGVGKGANGQGSCAGYADADGDGAADWTALLAGDAEHEQLAAMEEQGLVGRVDVLKVGHHGSKNALTPELAAALSPRIALVSAGAGNRYGHPADKTLRELADAGAQVWRTDEAGDVSCKSTAQGIAVAALR